MSTIKVTTVRNEQDSTAVAVNRTTSDGNILNVSKDGTVIGSLGSASSDVYLDSASGSIQLRYGGTEAARIDSSGNLLIGMSTYSASTDGVRLRQDGESNFNRDGQPPLLLNRLTSDGNIVNFYKDGTTVGSIGNDGSNLYIERNANSGLSFGSYQILPRRNGSLINNTVSLGNTSYTFADGYFGGGVYLGGTASANYLDDYEVGTYTTTATPLGGGSVTLNSTYNKLGYIRVGDLVYVSGLLMISSVSSPSGNLRLQLPFNVKSNQAGISSRFSGGCQFYDYSASNSTVGGYIGFAGDSTFNINSSSANTEAITWAASDEIVLGFCYQAA